MIGNRIIIPEELRQQTLERLHQSHQGIEKTKRRARDTVHWPGIDKDIREIIKRCNKCQELKPC